MSREWIRIGFHVESFTTKICANLKNVAFFLISTPRATVSTPILGPMGEAREQDGDGREDDGDERHHLERRVGRLAHEVAHDAVLQEREGRGE